MSETKTIVYPEGSNNCCNLMGMLAPFLNRGNLDANLLAMMNNNGFGNGNAWWILLLFLLWGRNGFGGYGENVPQMIANGDGREYLMQAINGNTNAINSLANNLNCDVNAMRGAINQIQSAICNVGNQIGMSSQAVINAVQSGSTSIIQQLCNCCCDMKQLVNSQGYENRISNIQQTNTIQNGFAQIGYQSAEQTCQLKQNANANTTAILAKLDAIEDSRKDREISNLTAQLTACNSRAERQQELAPIYKALADIQCKQPKTESVYAPSVIGIPTCNAYQLGLWGLGNMNGNGFL